MQLTKFNRTVGYPFPFLYPLSLLMVWLVGLLIGLNLSNQIPVESFSLMRMFSVSHVSIVWVLFVELFPFLISVLLLRYCSQYCILPVALFEGLRYSFCCCFFVNLFGDAAWLVCLVVFFFRIFSTPVLLFFWLFFPGVDARNRHKVGYSVLTMLILLGLIDYFALSPFWEVLLNR